MADVKLASDEARRMALHDHVKSKVQADVNSEIADRATATAPAEAAKIDDVAGQLRSKAVNEAIGGEREVDRARTAARGSQFLDYAFYLVYGLLLIRLALNLIAARSSNGFVQFIGTITAPLFAPFRGIVDSPSTDGGNTLSFPIIIAIVVYALLHAAINGILRMFAHRKTEI